VSGIYGDQTEQDQAKLVDSIKSGKTNADMEVTGESLTRTQRNIESEGQLWLHRHNIAIVFGRSRTKVHWEQKRFALSVEELHQRKSKSSGTA
jgi:hypothetical protein